MSALWSDATALLTALRDGDISAEAALDRQIARRDAVDGAYNAVVRVDIARARERARGLDAMREKGQFAGPLHGLPMTVKECFDVDGMPATAGVKAWAERAPQTPNASAVQALVDAGAVIWGKTNTAFMAADWQTDNPLYGRTNNPFDVERTPGGSSGGSAAALAAGIVCAELGSDIGGSLRIPAHFCGISTLKPTYGLVRTRGHAPPAPGRAGEPDLGVAGPMARSVRDLRLLFSVLTAQAVGPADPRPTLGGKRLALWMEEPGFPTSADCVRAVEIAGEAAQGLGAEVARTKPDLSGPEAIVDPYLRLLAPVVTEDAPAIQKAAIDLLRPLLALSKPAGSAGFMAAARARHHDWLKADEARARARTEMRAFFRNWTAVLTPVSPTPAFAHQKAGGVFSRRLDVDGARAPYSAHFNWIALATLCGLPAAVIPTGLNDAGLPVGVQIIGKRGGDLEVLEIAAALESRLGGFERPVSRLR